MTVEQLTKAKSLGFSDRQIAHLTGTTEDAIRAERKKLGLVPSYRLVDTRAAEFEAYTPCRHPTYDCADGICGRLVSGSSAFWDKRYLTSKSGSSPTSLSV